MRPLSELRELKNQKAEMFHNLMAKNPSNIPANVKNQLDGIIAEIDGINQQIEQQERLLQRTADNIVNGTIDHINGSFGRPTNDQMAALALFAKTGDATVFGDYRNALTEAGASGGAMVPHELASEIVRLQEAFSPMRKICTVVSIGTTASRYTQPVVTSGLEAGWTGETDERDATDPFTVEGVTFPDSEVYCNVPISAWFEEDTNTGKFLMTEIAKAFAKKEGAAFLLGNGVKQPKGILAHATALTADATRAYGTIQHVLSGAAADITADAFNDQIYSLNPAYRQNAKFVMSTTTLGIVRNLKDKNDRYLFDDTTLKLKGFEVIEANDMPEVAADALAIMFGDFKAAYKIVDRTMTVLRDPYSAKPNVLFYGRKRVSGELVDSNAVKVMKIGA